MKRLSILFIATLLVTSQVSSYAFGQAPGYDMWTGEMMKRLFEPHKDNCNSSTEVFIKMGVNGTGGDYGFCIEKDERSAAYYDDARQTCVALGKRLPEPVEYLFACNNYGGSLNNMTDDQEWASNFPVPLLTNMSGAYLQGVYVPTAGLGQSGGNCRSLANGVVGDYYISAFSIPYRCVY